MGEVVCFTGKGMISGPTLSGFNTSKSLSRAEWEQKARDAGHSVTDKAQNATLLVASRTDTSKAMNARARGLRVIDYDDFAAMCDRGWTPPGMNTASPASPVPPVRVTPTKPLDTSEMEENPLWAMF